MFNEFPAKQYSISKLQQLTLSQKIIFCWMSKQHTQNWLEMQSQGCKPTPFDIGFVTPYAKAVLLKK